MSDVVTIEPASKGTISDVDLQLQDYVLLLEGLTPENLERLREFTDESVEFIDPFNRVRGQKEMIGVFIDMFDRLQNIRFRVNDWQYQRLNHGYNAYLHWNFEAYSKLTGRFDVEGCSRLVITPQGKVIRHHDFWDASLLLEKVPLLGQILRVAKKRTSAHSPS
ncbi:MAG: nuclear transport factor 2 family protein [Motiliproteus sp.]|nr:nuclear transport factor 2 family protein [Motiliproteus sp.]MCW9052096.1 nuclear transport factor 2 family protein [Motiliproteus sp.]